MFDFVLLANVGNDGGAATASLDSYPPPPMPCPWDPVSHGTGIQLASSEVYPGMHLCVCRVNVAVRACMCIYTCVFCVCFHELVSV